jgi:hypothetical protein
VPNFTKIGHSLWTLLVQIYQSVTVCEHYRYRFINRSQSVNTAGTDLSIGHSLWTLPVQIYQSVIVCEHCWYRFINRSQSVNITGTDLSIGHSLWTLLYRFINRSQSVNTTGTDLSIGHSLWTLLVQIYQSVTVCEHYCTDLSTPSVNCDCHTIYACWTNFIKNSHTEVHQNPTKVSDTDARSRTRTRTSPHNAFYLHS